MWTRTFLLALAATLLGASLAMAADAEYRLVIRDHRFTPETLKIPANARIKLIVENADPTPEEFESYELNREKVVAGNSTATIYIGPLKPGTYPFFGDFHQDSAKGQIISE